MWLCVEQYVLYMWVCVCGCLPKYVGNFKRTHSSNSSGSNLTLPVHIIIQQTCVNSRHYLQAEICFSPTTKERSSFSCSVANVPTVDQHKMRYDEIFDSYVISFSVRFSFDFYFMYFIYNAICCCCCANNNTNNSNNNTNNSIANSKSVAIHADRWRCLSEATNPPKKRRMFRV